MSLRDRPTVSDELSTDNHLGTWVVTGGQKIPQNVWFAFESGNLFERLKQEGLPLPAKINYLKIYASGHNYDSLVSEVRLLAR